MSPFEVLGVQESSIKGKSDLERVRQKSKELYKKLAQKNKKHAERVLDAYERIKEKFKHLDTGAHGRSGGAKKDHHGAAGGQAGRKPEAAVESLRRQFSEGAENAIANGGHVVLPPPGGSRYSAAADKAVSRHGSHGSHGHGRGHSQQSHRKLRGVSHRDQSPAAPIVAVQAPRKAEDSTNSAARPTESGGATLVLDGFSSTIRSSGSLVLGRKAKIDSNGRKPEASMKRLSSQEALRRADAMMPASRAAGPKTVITVEGPDTSRRLVCKCGASLSASRFSGANLDAMAFCCPSCRVRAMDPFNAVKNGSKGVLKLKLVQKPVVPEDARDQASFSFRINLPKLKEWRKAGDNVEARMCRLDSYEAHQAWPNSMTVKVNGRAVIVIKPPQAGHKRRDCPKKLTPELKSGMNTFEVSLKDENVQRFALAVVRTSPQVPREICRQVPLKAVEECRKMAVDLLFSSMLGGCVEDFECVASFSSRLVCPITLSRLTFPARGKGCQHLQCFDLEAYLISNRRIGAFNKRWTCPVCNLAVKPRDLFVDLFTHQILGETKECDEEVTFSADGTWTVSATAADPESESDEEAAAATAAAAAGKPLGPPMRRLAGGQADATTGQRRRVRTCQDGDAVSMSTDDSLEAIEPQPGEVSSDSAEKGSKEGGEGTPKRRGGQEAGAGARKRAAGKDDQEAEAEGEAEAEAGEEAAHSEEGGQDDAMSSSEHAVALCSPGQVDSDHEAKEASGCQTDPYLAMASFDSDEEGLAEVLQNSRNSLSRTLSVATPAPLQSPEQGSDQEDKADVEEAEPPRKIRRKLTPKVSIHIPDVVLE